MCLTVLFFPAYTVLGHTTYKCQARQTTPVEEEREWVFVGVSALYQHYKLSMQEKVNVKSIKAKVCFDH